MAWLALALAACGSSSNAPAARAGATPDAATPDAPHADAGGSEPGPAGDSGAGAPFLPPDLTLRLVPGHVSLIGAGQTSCTNQLGATGDRWCGFVLPSSQTAGRAELWVLNATRAWAGANIRCDGTDASCLRIAADAIVGPYGTATESAFAGDTLFYRAGADATFSDGPVWAWRPGWPAGRQLVTGIGTACFAPATRAAALCEWSTHDAVTGDDGEDLLAGPLGPTDDGALPLIANVLLRLGADATGDLASFELGFSPDGESIAWSTTGTAAAKGLVVQKLDDPSTRTSVATDVSMWSISSDGASWVWLRDYQDSLITPSGTLQAARFPSGAEVTTLATSVADYELVGEKGLLYRGKLADQVGELRVMPDRNAPATSTLIDDGVRSVITRSADASTIVYSRVSTAVGVDLYVWSAGLAAPCTLTAEPSADRVASLMAGDRAVVWTQTDIMSQVPSGAVTSIASCQSQTFGRGLVASAPFDDAAYLFVDAPTLGAATGTLRAMRVGAGGAADLGTALQQDVSPVFAAVAPNAVLYTTSAGLYMYTGRLLGAP
jgi:hypothetical protein